MQARHLRQFSLAVGTIYDAALEPSRWPEAVRQIAGLHATDKALIFTPVLAPQDGGFVFPHGLTEQVLQEWGTKYITHDVWTQAGIARGLGADGTAVLDTDLVPDSAFELSLFYRDFLSRHDIGRLCSGWVFDGKDGAPMTGCSVYRERLRPFTTINRELHGLTLSHLSRALGTMMRLRDRELKLAATLGALDRLPGAIVLAGRRGNVVFANRAARALLAANDGITLSAGNAATDAEGWLTATAPESDARLQAAIRLILAADPRIVTHFNRGVTARRPSGKADLVVQLSPLGENNEYAGGSLQPAAIVFISDPTAVPHLDETLLNTLYGLTIAEVRVAQALLLGKSLPEVGARLKLSENTVKKHLQAIFDKTGTRRQAQLVKLLMGLAN